MCMIATLVVITYLVLFLLAGKEQPDKIPGGIRAPFYKAGFYLYKRICLLRMPIAGRKQVEKDLARLHPGENREVVCTDYYVGKIALSLFICLVGTILGLFITINGKKALIVQEDGSIARGTFAEGARELELIASFADGGENSFSVVVDARQLTEVERNTYLESFVQELPSLIVGENTSLQEIRYDLLLEEEYEGYPFTVEWSSSKQELVSSTGTVKEPESATGLTLIADVTYAADEDWEYRQEISICVMPPVLSAEERLQQGLEDMLREQELLSRKDAIWVLPDSFQGERIHWRQAVPDYSLLLWGGALLTAVITFFLADKDIHDSLEVRRAEMKRSYPDVVQKLALYMGAGLTVRAAFQKMAGNYEKGRVAGKKKNYIYEEIMYACRELQAGVSEGSVYEHFGKRVGLQEYIRLSTLLMQNLKKGNRTLLQRLKEEADKACIEQLQNSRKLGEEASTKLLLPMMLMLAVVMVLIMIPAFSSVGI